MSKTGSKTPIPTPKKRRKCVDPVEVSCRLRPLMSTDSGQRCIERVSETSLKLIPPASSSGHKSREEMMKAMEQRFYTFHNIFMENESQKAIFDRLAMPLVEDLIKGKNGLLFAYGVTCSGKTHTMIGQASNPGILPRCLDVIFNSIGENQARPYIFLPDDNNGMKIQPEYQAALMKNSVERQKRQEERLRKKEGRPGTPHVEEKPDEIRIPDNTKLECANEDSAYAVFISYIEVYNNYIFDLLADEHVDQLGNPILPESKKVGEDPRRKVMYVKDVNEVEVKSTEEACAQVWRGQERRRKAATILNDSSSRSHSVFNIRLVQAPYDEEGKQILVNKELLTISQLSLVDLAGSERASRTNATGGTLKEAGNINNSLMTLHACLEALRANQLSNKPNRIVPYRESRLTLLFKSFFEGQGKVKMIVCMNPRVEDYDETVHVMKFAEMTQDVVVARGQEVQFDENVLQPGRRKQNLLFKRISGSAEPLAELTNRNSFGFNLPAVPPAFCLPPLPSWSSQDGTTSEDKLQAILAALHERQKMKKDAMDDFEKRKQRMRAILLQMEKEHDEFINKNSAFENEMGWMHSELSTLRSDKLRLEKEMLKQKREIEKLRKHNNLLSLENRRLNSEKEKVDEKMQKELMKREKLRSTFKGVVKKEKQKWEDQMEVALRERDLQTAREKSQLRQVIEIIGGNPDLIPRITPSARPKLDDIVLPSTDSSETDFMSEGSPQQYNYTLPFKPTKHILSSRDDQTLPPLPLSSPPKSEATKVSEETSTRPAFLSPSTKPGLLTPSSAKPSPSTAKGSTSKTSSKHTTPNLAGAVKVLPSHPSPKTLTPNTPGVSSKYTPTSAHTSKTNTPFSAHTSKPNTPFSVHTSKPNTPFSVHTSKPNTPFTGKSGSSSRGREAAKNSPHKPDLRSAATSIRGLDPAHRAEDKPTGEGSNGAVKSRRMKPEAVSPARECHITVLDRPDIPLRARIANEAGCGRGGKWLDHRPPQNLDEECVLKPSMDNKKTVPVPDVDDFDSQTNKYLLHHQEQDSQGEIRTHFIKGDVKVSRGGGRCVEFTDIETSSKVPSARQVLSHKQSTYPPPEIDCGDWTDTETRCAIGLGIPLVKSKPPISR